MKKKAAGRVRRAKPDDSADLQRDREIRDKVRHEFPPRDPPRLMPASSGIAAKIRTVREARGLTWYAVAREAGISSANTVRDIEYGRDTNFSNIEAVAKALGLRIELVEA